MSLNHRYTSEWQEAWTRYCNFLAQFELFLDDRITVDERLSYIGELDSQVRTIVALKNDSIDARDKNYADLEKKYLALQTELENKYREADSE
jgi:hypothetical protein